MNELIVGLWVVGAAGKGAVCWRLAASHLIRRYPLLTASLGLSALRSSAVLIALAVDGWSGYGALWKSTQWVAALTGWLVTIEACYVMARHYPRPVWIAALVASPLGLAGAAAGSLARMAPATPAAVWWGVSGARAAYVTLSIMVVLAGIFFRWIEPGMRPNVQRHVSGAAVGLASSFAASCLLGMPGYWFVAAGQIVLAGVPLWSLWVWSRIDARGEWHVPAARERAVRVVGVGA